MIRPIQQRRFKSRRQIWFIVALVPIIMTGFIATPSERGQKSEHQPVNIEALMKSVMDLNKQKKHQKAIDLLLAVTDQQKDDALLRALLVQTFDLFLEDEIKLGQKAIQKNPVDQAGYYRVSGALELMGDNARAMEILLGGLQFHRQSSDMWMKIARLELKAHRDMEALDVFKEVIRLDHKNGDAYNNAAYILTQQKNGSEKDLKEAEHLATMARKLNPKNPEYLDTLAEVHFKQGRRDQAQTLMEEAVRLAPDNDIFKNQLKKYKNSTDLMPK